MINPRSFKPTIFLFLCLLHTTLGNAQEVNIIPYPKNIEIQNGMFILSDALKIYYTKACKKEADFLKHILLSEHQLHVRLAEHHTAVTTGNVYLLISHADFGTLGSL